jgi:nitronate monooxygenase
MGGGLAGPELAAAVADAGGLGTLGLAPAGELRDSIALFRDGAPGRAVAVNLLTPFLRRSQVSACVRAGIDVAVVAFGGDRELVEELTEAGVFVFVMVGTQEQARRAVSWGAHGLIAQGGEAGGHLCGTIDAMQFLPRALAVAGDRPVLLAGGIATASDTRAALAAGASGVIAGTRFLLTHESRAHPEYQRRILAADRTVRTMLFGLGWPAPHRVVPNAATARWCDMDGTAKLIPRLVNGGSAVLAKLPATNSVLRMQHPKLPLFSPIAPTVGMPASAVDRAACYAGQTALRLNSVTSARQAVADLSPGGQ